MTPKNILCVFGMHDYKAKGKPTKAYGRNGEYIYKSRVVCSRCGDSKLVVTKRVV